MKPEILAVALGMITQVAQLRAQSGPADGNGPVDPAKSAARPAIVLVHGGFVDGSGWQAVYQQLRRDGYTVDAGPLVALLNSRDGNCGM